MSQIRCIYHGAAPKFPATDQHPDAERFFVAGGIIHTEAEWRKLIDAAMAEAGSLVFGTADADAIEAAITGAAEARGELKAHLAAEAAPLLPAPDLVVDAIGTPSLEEIDARVNPPPAPAPTVEQKLAAAGISIPELKQALGL